MPLSPHMRVSIERVALAARRRPRRGHRRLAAGRAASPGAPAEHDGLVPGVNGAPRSVGAAGSRAARHRGARRRSPPPAPFRRPGRRPAAPVSRAAPSPARATPPEWRPCRRRSRRRVSCRGLSAVVAGKEARSGRRRPGSPPPRVGGGALEDVGGVGRSEGSERAERPSASASARRRRRR